MKTIALALVISCTLIAPVLAAPKAKAAEGRREAIELLAQGQALEKQQDFAGAITLYQQSAQLAPSPAAYYHIAKAYAQQGDKKTAKQYYQQALDLNPNYELAKMEMITLGGSKPTADYSMRSGETEPPVSGDNVLNVDAVHREYQTVTSLRRPESLHPADELNPPASALHQAARRGKTGFIPASPQNPGAGDRPGVPLAAARPTAPGTARRALETPEPVMIVNEHDMKLISPQEPEPVRVAGTTFDRPHAPPSQIMTDPSERESIPFADTEQPPERSVVAQHGGGATGSEVKGGMPSAAEINAAAFGPDAQAQKPSTGYQNMSKVALGTYAFHKERGDKYRALERWKDAASEYETAIRLAPTDSETRTLLAEMLAKAGASDEADAQFARVEAGSPDDPRVAYKQGNLYRDQKKPDLAIGAYRRAITIDPNHKFAHNNLGVVYMEKGDYANAVVHFKRVLELDPSYDKAMLNLGIIYDDHLANKPQALKYYEMYLKAGGDRTSEVQTWVDALKEQM